MVWPAIIAGVAGLAGAGISALGSAADRSAQSDIANMNAAQQREFAQHGIRWKVADAQAAGVHPIYALGAQTHSFAPSSYSPVGDGGAGAIVAQSGQDIGRAVHATRTRDERHTAVMKSLLEQRGMLENQLLGAQIAKLSQVGPPMASMGVPGVVRSGVATPSPGDLGQFKVEPSEAITKLPGTPDYEAGPSRPQTVLRDAGGGRFQTFPASDAIQDQEATNPLMLRWMLTQSWRKPPQKLWPKGAVDMTWTPLGWQPVFIGRSGGRALGRGAGRGPGIREGLRSLQMFPGYYGR